jgi:large subunit ribosomal protein L15
MMIHEITSKVGKYKGRRRVGRGPGSGHGKTSGRGHKGAGSRSGNSRRAYFEGGQMTWVRRMPKRGFTNSQFRTDYHVVNLKSLQERFADGDTVNIETLKATGLIRDTKKPLKILGEGDLTLKLDVTANKLSKSAEAKITAAGGTVTVNELKKWTRDRSVPTAASKKKAAKLEATAAKSAATKTAATKAAATEADTTETNE